MPSQCCKWHLLRFTGVGLCVCRVLCSQAVPNLPLPAVVNDTVVVHHADMRCYASASAVAAAGSKPADAGRGAGDSAGAAAAASSPAAAVWGQLEQLVAGGDMPSTNWLEGAKQVCVCVWQKVHSTDNAVCVP